MKARLEQALELVRLLTFPGALRAFFRWKPFSITAFRMLYRLRQQGLQPRTVLDGGANQGQFARAALETFPEARLLAFEPLPDVAETLRRNLADDARAQVYETALGRHDGQITFHQNAYSLSSSALPLHAHHLAAFPHARPLRTLEVPVARLDTLLDGEKLTPPVLLKLDLQGFELEALRGAPATLGRVDYVLLEVAFKPMYEGEPLFPDLYDHMRAAGFVFARPIDVLPGLNGEIVQMDALFVRAT